MSNVDDTALPTSSTTPAESVEEDVENEVPTVALAASIPPVVQADVTDVIGKIKDMLDGDTTTADGTVIPKEVIRNTACIIFGDFAATFIAYTVISNIVIFGEQFLRLDRDDVEEWSLVAIGADAVFLLLTGCFTDWYGGSYEAMHIYGVIILVGSCILPLITFDWSIFGPSVVIPIIARRVLFYMSRIIIGLGVSGISVTAPPFAARQIEKYGTASVQSCFHYIYTVVQFAPLLALTGVSFIQLNVSFFVGYSLTVVVNIVTMVFFKYARNVFQQTTPDKGKAASLVVTAAGNAIKSKVTTILTTFSSCCRCNCCPNLCSSLQKIDGESVELLSDSALISTSTTVDVADVEDPSTLSSTVNPSGSASVDKSTSCIGPAPTAVTYGTLDLDTTMTAESIQEALPETARHALWVCYAIVLLSCEFPFSIVRYQVASSFVSQAERMKPTILGQAVSPSLLAQYLPLLGIALAPLVNAYIYPYVSKRFATLTMLIRTIIGIAFATLSVLSAATVETARLTFIDRGDFFIQEINNQTVVASTLSLDFLIPQYFFMGVADVFIFITGLEFAFTQSPCNVQAIVTGIFLFYEATGRIVAILLVPLINTITAADPWYPPEINDGHLNYYFLVLTAISLTNLIMFFMMEKGYEVVDGYLCPDEETIEANTNTVMPLPQPVSSITSSA